MKKKYLFVIAAYPKGSKDLGFNHVYVESLNDSDAYSDGFEALQREQPGWVQTHDMVNDYVIQLP